MAAYATRTPPAGGSPVSSERTKSSTSRRLALTGCHSGNGTSANGLRGRPGSIRRRIEYPCCCVTRTVPSAQRASNATSCADGTA